MSLTQTKEMVVINFQSKTCKPFRRNLFRLNSPPSTLRQNCALLNGPPSPPQPTSFRHHPSPSTAAFEVVSSNWSRGVTSAFAVRESEKSHSAYMMFVQT
ncbi:OLC1v1008635C1 [Oldenlandia corymbosa var. corymbosa]|uniref:OLC1v1008635C1 n=1 Tax=Oldenlandia corymbosa var. corymbosa TaxID=529605 RepID=A0AAV1DM57_OLDCO|nr:OLC1v1008635C1 [Oldenlandia corymbosa var. corymbosa]